MVPGFTGSGPDHWQSHWERARPDYLRLEQRDWDRPDPAEWVRALDERIATFGAGVVLVGHSLGCITIARWALLRVSGAIAGAMLVAPSDVEVASAPPEVRGFATIPMVPLGFESLVVSSDDDPLVTAQRARGFAAAWGSRFISIGNAGHINTASGHGPWPEGFGLLREFIDRCARSPGTRVATG